MPAVRMEMRFRLTETMLVLLKIPIALGFPSFARIVESLVWANLIFMDSPKCTKERFRGSPPLHFVSQGYDSVPQPHLSSSASTLPEDHVSGTALRDPRRVRARVPIRAARGNPSDRERERDGRCDRTSRLILILGFVLIVPFVTY